MNITNELNPVSLNDFGEAAPDGFQLKTTMEINTLVNKYSFVANLPVEQTRPIKYELDNAVLLTVRIVGEDNSYLTISKCNLQIS